MHSQLMSYHQVLHCDTMYHFHWCSGLDKDG